MTRAASTTPRWARSCGQRHKDTDACLGSGIHWLRVSPSQSAEGAAAPYWNSYSYDAQAAPGQNNLQSETTTPPSGNAATTTYTYAAPGPGSAQPHAIQTATTTGSAASSYGYEPAGNTTQIKTPSGTQNLNWDDASRMPTAARTQYITPWQLPA
jgi:YD repeat-containing protein